MIKSTSKGKSTGIMCKSKGAGKSTGKSTGKLKGK